MFTKYITRAFGLFVVLFGASSPAIALTINGWGEVGGSYTAEAEYDETTGTLTLVVENTSASGYLTAIAFNNPGSDEGDGAITSVALDSSSAPDSFGLLGEPDFDNTVLAAPFGQFDIGAASASRWLGGGLAIDGLAAGDTMTLVFTFSGDLSQVSLSSLFGVQTGEYSEPPRDSGGQAVFAVRFNGFECPTEDQCSGGDGAPGVAPIPAALGLFLSGLGVLGLWGARRRLRARA